MRVLIALLVALVSPVPVYAHVVVVPAESEAGGWERYSVLVPTEKESATTRVEVRLPNGMDVIAVEAKPGWQGRYDPFPVGAARVSWEGGRIASDEFVSFEFLAWNPKAPTVVQWQATQWYEDGSSDRWGAPGTDADHASRTTLTAATSKGGMHRHEPAVSPPAGSKPAAPQPAAPKPAAPQR
jgi:uncharacterized protein YcnI